MLQPLRNRAQGKRARPMGQVAVVKTLQAPVLGWNARDALSAMRPGYAIRLENLLSTSAGLELRNGFESHATGLGAAVETLMEYSPPSGSNKLFAAVPTAIYNVTSAGAVGAAVVSSLTNGRWQHIMTATSGGNFLCLVNGADNYRTYDGTTWTDQAAAVTGVTSSTLIGIALHHKRIWFVQKDTLDAWYLPVSSIIGAATKFPLGAECKSGGYLLAIGSWTRDGGEGMDDVIAFITSNGEVVVYSGIDPSDAAAFTRIGTFKIAEPIGRRCLIRAGADLGIITSQGIQLLSQVIDKNVSGQAGSAITDAISGAFQSSWESSGANFGWQIIEYPKKELVLINVPIAERSTQNQYVISMETGAWSKFTGINAGCWSLLGDDLYLGNNSGTVYRYSGYLDATVSISWSVQWAFTNCGTPNYKRFTAARPLFTGPTFYTPAVEMKVDYDEGPITLPATISESTGAIWGTAIWYPTASTIWGNLAVARHTWQTVTGFGLVGSPAMSGSNSTQFILHAVDVNYEVAGHL